MTPSANFPVLTLKIDITDKQLSYSPQIQWNDKDQGQQQRKKRES